MAFAGGSVSFQRFFIDGPLPEAVDDQFMSKLAARTFGKVQPQADGSHLGWIGSAHLFDTEPAPEAIAVGRFAHFALRIDTVKVPSNILRSYQRQEEQVALEAAGREFLTKPERRAAKEAAQSRADAELRAGHFRRVAAYPVLVDLEQKTVYFGALGAGAADRLMALFADTFGARLQPADVDTVALRLAKAADLTRPLEHVAPTNFVPPPAEDAEQANDFNTDQRFLGREMLLWLWHQIDESGSALQIRSGDDVTVAFARTLKLECVHGLTGTDTISALTPTDLPEANAALAIGKQPTKAGLILGTPLGEFQCTLDTTRWTVSSSILPELSDEIDEAGKLEQRFDLVADLATLLDGLFEVFLHRRLQSTWQTDQRTISQWLRSDAEATKPRVLSA